MMMMMMMMINSRVTEEMCLASKPINLCDRSADVVYPEPAGGSGEDLVFEVLMQSETSLAVTFQRPDVDSLAIRERSNSLGAFMDRTVEREGVACSIGPQRGRGTLGRYKAYCGSSVHSPKEEVTSNHCLTSGPQRTAGQRLKG